MRSMRALGVRHGQFYARVCRWSRRCIMMGSSIAFKNLSIMLALVVYMLALVYSYAMHVHNPRAHVQLRLSQVRFSSPFI